MMNQLSLSTHRNSLTSSRKGAAWWWWWLILLSLSTFSSSPAVVFHIQAWTTSTPVSQLLTKYSDEIAELKSIVQETLTTSASSGSSNDKQQLTNIMKELPYSNDVYYLRFCLLAEQDNENPKTKLQESLTWRMSEQGQSICTAARTAVTQATTTTTTTNTKSPPSNCGWTNDNQKDVFALAPFATKIQPYISPSNCITTSLENGDLIYCIRAGAINDVGLFQSVTINEMIDFFLYVKEIHALVSDIRSLSRDQLLYTITCNDLSNVKLLGGSSDFRKALSSSSTMASTVIYPSTYTGPTLLCNLPLLVSALVQLFTPLFPEKVKQRLKFVQGPLAKVNDLTEIATSSSTSSGKRTEFLQQINKALQ